MRGAHILTDRFTGIYPLPQWPGYQAASPAEEARVVERRRTVLLSFDDLTAVVRAHIHPGAFLCVAIDRASRWVSCKSQPGQTTAGQWSGGSGNGCLANRPETTRCRTVVELSTVLRHALRRCRDLTPGQFKGPIRPPGAGAPGLPATPQESPPYSDSCPGPDCRHKCIRPDPWSFSRPLRSLRRLAQGSRRS